MKEGLEPLRLAQEEVLGRLDAMLVELRTISQTMSEVHALLRADRSRTLDLDGASIGGGTDGLVN